MGVETRTIARQAKAWVERSQSSRKTKEPAAPPPLTCPARLEEEEGEARTRRNLAELLSWCAAAPIALKAAVATTVEGKAILEGIGRCHSDGGGFAGVLTPRQARLLRRATGGCPLLAPPCVLDRISAGLASLPISDILLATLDARVAAVGGGGSGPSHRMCGGGVGRSRPSQATLSRFQATTQLYLTTNSLTCYSRSVPAVRRPA